MTSLVLGLALATPGQPPFPAVHPAPFPPGVRQFPQMPGGPVFRPGFPPPNPGPLPPAFGALTLDQFSRVFVPTAGRHHYRIIHPRTGFPVDVCFTLPHCGKLDRLEVSRNRIEIELDRPDFEVEIEFRSNGTVRIDYDD